MLLDVLKSLDAAPPAAAIAVADAKVEESRVEGE